MIAKAGYGALHEHDAHTRTAKKVYQAISNVEHVKEAIARLSLGTSSIVDD